MNVLLLVAVLTGGVEPEVVWQKVLGDTGHNEALHGMALEYPSALYVIGEDSFMTRDVASIRFNLEGEILDNFSYDEEGRADVGDDIDIGEEGSVYVAGHSLDTILLLLKFDSTGKKVWDNRVYEHLGGQVLSSESGIYFAGWYYLIDNPDLRIFKYDYAGKELWRDFWQPVGDQTPAGLALDSKESMIFIGVRSPYIWGSWRSDGTPRVGIIPRYEDDLAHAEGITLNSVDQVFVCGDIGSDRRSFMLIKTDTLGHFLWSDSAKVYDLGADERCRDIKLDSGPASPSDCYLAGWQVGKDGDENTALVKTDSAGGVLWSWVDTIPGKQEIEAIEIDPEGYIYLAGSHHNGTDWDMLVMKLRQPLTISGKVTDSTGKAMSNTPVAVSGDTTLEVLTDNNGNYEITIYNGGNYTIKPNLPGYTFEPASRTYTPLAHREWNQDFDNCHWIAIKEQHSILDPSMDIFGLKVRYSLPEGQDGTITIYNACGIMIGSKKVTGSGEAGLLEGFPSGVYFVKLKTDRISISHKAVVLR